MGDFPFMPEVPGMLRHLAAKGITTVIITNGHHKVQRDKLEACNAAALFPEPEKIIVGGEEVLEGREEKPAVSIFMKACGVAGCKPEEAIHVGDSLTTDVQVWSSRAGGGVRGTYIHKLSGGRDSRFLFCFSTPPIVRCRHLFLFHKTL